MIAPSEKLAQFTEEDAPRRLVLEDDVIAARERHEARSGNARRQPTTFVERNDTVLARVKDDRRGGDRAEQRPDVELGERLHQSGGILGRRRDALQIVEPFHLLRTGVGNEARREELAERGMPLAPAETGQAQERGS